MAKASQYNPVHVGETWESAQKVQPPDARLCPTCLGMRFVQKDVPPGDAAFSAIYACPTCRRQA